MNSLTLDIGPYLYDLGRWGVTAWLIGYLVVQWWGFRTSTRR